ncbi:hypothetical protein OSG_eHP8_00250 [environmental Halophage eHP-8]|nr:hypothetical protein OSG_eHP8_00250 [environmental Halophage eHP-8]AFH21975.1 hypothetical protein OSG_eHP13_00255 [environmental Halophage eHP-13]
MTTEYKTLRVPEPDYEQARESKHDSETWGEFLRRCSDNPPETKEYVDATRGVQLEATEYEKIAREVVERLQ